MKYVYLAAAVSLSLAGLASSATAQVTLGDATLPRAGDRFETVVDTTYADANGNVARAGANQIWLFGDIEAEDVTCTDFRAASEGGAGADFPDAALVVRTGVSCGGDNSEVYLRRAGGDLDVIGLGAGGNLGDELPMIRLDEPVPYQRTPFAFGASTAVETTQRLTFGGGVLVALAADDPELVTALAIVDSVRVTLAIETSIEADGWGRAGESATSLTDVLRLRRVTDATQVVEVSVPLLGYIDIESLPNVDAGFLPPLVQSVVSYEWWSPEEAAPLYRVSLDSVGAVTSAERSSAVVTGLAEAAAVEDAVELRVRAGQVVLTRQGASGEGLAVRVYDAAGATRAVAALEPGQASAELSTEGWPAGLYVAEVRTEWGAVEAHRFVVW